MDEPFEGVIFDMDGTLIESHIDFEAIRRHLEIPIEVGILEAIRAMPAAQGQQASGWLLERELEAVRTAPLVDGAEQTVQALRRAGLKTALLTRNAPEAMALVLERFGQLEFDLAWSRDEGPIKPEPDGILRACKLLGIRCSRTACVGDFRYDVLAANRAGAVSVLLAPNELPPFAHEARHVIRSLGELPGVLGIE